MRKTTLGEFEDLQAFQRHPKMPTSVQADERDVDDYEDFEDGDMINALWHRGEELSEDELLSGEDY
jgi:hypothetical protein